MEKRPEFIENEIYHVYNRCNGYEPIFRNFGNYDYFLKRYHEYLDPYWETLTWCLMPSHFHLMIRVKSQPPEKSPVSNLCIKAYADFCNGYVQAFNKQHSRKGSLFMRNFKRKIVSDDMYARKLICYIHNNPVQDGYVRTPQEWHHSSFREFLQMEGEEARNNQIIQRFGSKDDFYHAHIAEISPGSIDIKSVNIDHPNFLGNSIYMRMLPPELEKSVPEEFKAVG
jgi:putative transposase